MTVTSNLDQPVIVSDPLRINIILGNIISNAYKYYNPEESSYLKININTDNQYTEISFRDNGIGIKEEYMDRIFDMFFRATERSQGRGLECISCSRRSKN